MRNRKRNGRAFESLETRLLLAADAITQDPASPFPDPQAIVGGTETGRGVYEWVASLQIEGFGHFCGGTLVAADAIVTAAHCVEGASTRNLVAVVGREDLTRNDDGEELRISQIIVHPDYNEISNSNDIAILLLEDFSTSTPIDYISEANTSLAAPGRIQKLRSMQHRS